MANEKNTQVIESDPRGMKLYKDKNGMPHKTREAALQANQAG